MPIKSFWRSSKIAHNSLIWGLLRRDIGLPGSNNANRKLCHRDISPGNILLNEHFMGKVADVGLGKPIADESRIRQSIASSVLESNVTGKVGTAGYRCHIYEGFPSYAFGPECDMFSFGAVMVSVITGTFSGIGTTDDDREQLHGDERSFYHRYIKPEHGEAPRDLLRDVDPCLDGNQEDLRRLCNLAKACLSSNVDIANGRPRSGFRVERPSARDAVLILQPISSRSRFDLDNSEEGLRITSSGSSAGVCYVCSERRDGASCGNHFLCLQCL